MRRLILRSFQSPGDVVMLTAAVRDLHVAYPGQFETDVRTSADALWEHNPWLTRLNEGTPGVEVLDMHYPLVHQSNQRPYTFCTAIRSTSKINSACASRSRNFPEIFTSALPNGSEPR